MPLLTSLPYWVPCIFSIIAPPRNLSQRLQGLHPQFSLGRLTPPHRVRVSDPLSPNSDSDYGSSGSPSISILCSPPPFTFIMSGAGPTSSGGPGSNAETTTSGAATGMIPATPLLPYMGSLSITDLIS